MRTERRQPKEQNDALIPDDLAAFLGEVSALIASSDELVTIESDDLLQFDRGYGGLIEENGDRYAFTYFPEAGVRQKWIFELSAAEVTAIASGSQTRLRLWWCKSADCRSGFQRASDACFYCDYVEE